MTRAAQKRADRREIADQFALLPLDDPGWEFAMDWGLIGHCRTCDGLQEDGECIDGGSWCPRAELWAAWERALVMAHKNGLSSPEAHAAADAARDAMAIPA